MISEWEPMRHHGPAPHSSRGFTLVEIMIVVVVISVAFLGLVGAFGFMAKSTQANRSRVVAANLARQKIDYYKGRNYYRVIPTTAAVSDPDFLGMQYDPGFNKPETIPTDTYTFERRVLIRRVSDDPSAPGTNLSYKPWNDPDTGLKEVLVYVVWNEAGRLRKVQLTNLIQNEERALLSCELSGQVMRSGGLGPLSGATVVALENFARMDTSDGGGNYAMAVEPGTYTLRASAQGYFPQVKGPFFIHDGNTPISVPDFALVKRSTGRVAGVAYRRDHLVISEVCAAEALGLEQAEWVELYNPTTSPWTLTFGPAGNPGRNIKLEYIDNSGGRAEFVFGALISVTLPSEKFMVIQAMPGGDVNYTAPPGGLIPAGQPGAVVLTNDLTGGVLDSVAWGGLAVPFPGKEGTPLAAALGPEQTIERRAQATSAPEDMHQDLPTGSHAADGNAWDTDNNTNDWVLHGDLGHTTPLHGAKQDLWTAGAEAPLTGTPAAGGMVFMDDGLSLASTVDSMGRFELVNVATGTDWRLLISNGGVQYSTWPVNVPANALVDRGTVTLDTPATYGYIAGQVTSGLLPLPNIPVDPGVPNERQLTRADGTYLVKSMPGAVDVTANRFDDPGWVSPYIENSSNSVTIRPGEITAGVNINLLAGGRIRGRVETAGVSPMGLPGIPVVATQMGVEKGSALSQPDGVFEITRLSLGTYEVFPKIEPDESVTPSTPQSVTVTGGAAPNSAGTFSFSANMDAVSGRVLKNGQPIKTGVLIYASETPLGAGFTKIDPAFRAGPTRVFGAVSQPDGSYRVAVPVDPSGKNYWLYAWYTTCQNGSCATTRKDKRLNVVPGGVGWDFIF
jgi:prepilin-type N-terminal cleavage/methylation domain-containing protein